LLILGELLIIKMNTTTYANGYPGPGSRQAQKGCKTKPLMGYQPSPSTYLYPHSI